MDKALRVNVSQCGSRISGIACRQVSLFLVLMRGVRDASEENVTPRYLNSLAIRKISDYNGIV